jgi:hypothetical protein
MDADLKKIRKLAHLMQKEGILSVKSPDLEIQLSPVAMFYEPASKQELPGESKENLAPDYTEDQILMWSTSAASNEVVR